MWSLLPVALVRNGSHLVQNADSHFHWGVCREFGWVGFLVVCFLYKTNPTPRKNILMCEKVAQMQLLTNYLGVGLALGWGVRRFQK